VTAVGPTDVRHFLTPPQRLFSGPRRRARTHHHHGGATATIVVDDSAHSGVVITWTVDGLTDDALIPTGGDVESPFLGERRRQRGRSSALPV
jgi:hypothetical protein